MSAEDNLIKMYQKEEVAPQEAAKNIENAPFFEVEPDVYSKHAEKFDKEIKAGQAIPEDLEEGTKEYLSQGQQYRGLASEDVDKLNFIEKRLKYYRERIIDIPNMRRDNNELWNKLIDTEDGSLSPEEQEQLDDGEFLLNNMQQQTYGIDGDVEPFVVETLSGVGDIARSYWENKEILGSSVATGAGAGLLIGAGIPLPGARVAGAKAGAVQGFIVGSGIVGYLDQYRQMRAEVYKELTYGADDKGNPLEMDHKAKKAASTGVAVIAGIIGGAGGFAIAKVNPLAKRFVSSKTAMNTLMKNPAMLARMKVLGSMAQSAFIEGGEEGLTEFANVAGVEFAKMDDTDGSFINAIDNIFSATTAERVGQATALGASVGSTFAAGSGAVALPGLQKQYKEAQQLAIKKHNILNKQNNLLETASLINSTKIKELSPNEMSNFKKRLFSIAGIDEEVWIHLEDMQEFADTDEKRELVIKMIDPTGQLNKMSTELNTPLLLKDSDVLGIVEEFPEFTDYVRIEPEGQTPRDVRTEAQDFAGRLGEARAKREEILEELGVDGEMTPEQQAEIAAILDPKVPDQNIQNEQDFYEDIRFEPIEGIIDEVQVQELNTMELDARLAVAESIKADVEQKMQRVENKIFRDVNQKDIKTQIQELDRELKIVERFTKKEDSLKINPESLSPELRRLYLDQPEIKKKLGRRRTFSKDGLNIDEAVVITGVESADQLLKILAETPSKNQIKKNRDQRKIELRNRINQTLEPARATERDKAFTNLTKLRLRQMNYLVQNEWPTMRRGAIKIAGNPPKAEGLNRKAKQIINKTKLKDLNPRRFEAGERRSRKKAMEHWTKTEFEQTYKNLEASAMNVELRKEAMNAKDRVESAERFWKRVENDSSQETLRKAGMLDTMEEFTDVFKMSRSERGLKELKSFQKFIERQVEEGNYTPAVPERLDDVTQSAQDMTVEQYLEITDMGKFILNQARLKNKLLKIQKERAELVTAEKIAERIDEVTKAHPNYDEKKIHQKPTDYQSVAEKFNDKFKTALTNISSIKTIVAELDGLEQGGYFQQVIGEPIKNARNNKRAEIDDIQKSDKKIIQEYGEKKFKRLFNEFVIIPEFADRITLGDGRGKIRKIDLFTIQAYMGDPMGRQALQNFVNSKNEKLSLEDIQTVLNRELDSKDAAFVQSFMVDRFRRFRERSFELHKRTAGVEPTMVEGVPVRHRDKDFPGGYYPIRRQRLPDSVQAEKFLDKVKNNFNEFTGTKESSFFAKMRAAEMTDQGRLKERTGSERPLDIIFENVFAFTEEAVHDLNFREVGIDVLKILKNPINVKNIKAVVGPKKFTSLLNHTKDVISKTSEQESTIFREEANAFKKIIDGAHYLHAVKVIGLNYTSALIQPVSLLNISLRAGFKSNLYLAKTAKKMLQNPDLFEQYVTLATEVNPDIGFEKDGIDSAIVKQSFDYIPERKAFFGEFDNAMRARAKISEMKKSLIDSSFIFVRETDRLNKIVATLALTEQFLNGDFKNFPKEKLDKMTEAEKVKQMRSVVQQTIDLSLTASAPEDKTAIEKNQVASMFVRYWTDRRSRLNTMIAQAQKAGISVKQGDYRKAVGTMLLTGLSSAVSLSYMKLARDGFEEAIEEIEDIRNTDDFTEFAIDKAWDFATAPVREVADMTPIIDNINYAANLDIISDYRNVSTPFFGVLSDVAMGTVATGEIIDAWLRLDSPSLSKVQRKALLTNAGYLIGGAPTNAIYKLTKLADSREVRQTGRFLKDAQKTLIDNFNLFKEQYGNDPKNERFINALEEEVNELVPQYERDVEDIIPENTKEMLNQGEWDMFNPDTGAAGPYQFTEERWEEIMELAPSLGLTEDGRVSKNTEEQERAINWVIQDNTRGLIAFDIPVNNETLYGSHRFEFENYTKIHDASDSKKLSEVLGKSVKDDPLFKGFDTVKSVKNHISEFVKKNK